MNEDNIQSQIKLVAFKAVHAEFNVTAKSSDKFDKPKFELQLSDLLSPTSPNNLTKVFNINLLIDIGEELIEIKVVYHTVFQCSTLINEDFLQTDFAKISAPAIGFPYVRSFISTITIQAGVPPVILPSINFVQFAANEKRQTS